MTETGESSIFDEEDAQNKLFQEQFNLLKEKRELCNDFHEQGEPYQVVTRIDSKPRRWKFVSYITLNDKNADELVFPSQSSQTDRNQDSKESPPQKFIKQAVQAHLAQCQVVQIHVDKENKENQTKRRRRKILTCLMTSVVILFVLGLLVYVDKPRYWGIPEVMARIGIPIESMSQKCQEALKTVENQTMVVGKTPQKIEWQKLKKAKRKLYECYDYGVYKENAEKGLGLAIDIYVKVGDDDKASNSYYRAKRTYEDALEIAQRIKNTELINQISLKIKSVQRTDGR